MNRMYLKQGIYLITGLIVGILIGAASLTVLVSYRLDTYHERINYLEAVVQDKDARLKKLEESINNRRFILKDIEIVLLYDGSDIEKIDLNKHIKEKYNNLIGKEVKGIDIELAAGIIDNRIMRLGDMEYRLKVQNVMLSDILKIWIDVSAEGQESSE